MKRKRARSDDPSEERLRWELQQLDRLRAGGAPKEAVHAFGFVLSLGRAREDDSLQEVQRKRAEERYWMRLIFDLVDDMTARGVPWV